MNATQFRQLKIQFQDINTTMAGFKDAIENMTDAYSKANKVVEKNTKLNRKNKKELREQVEQAEGITKRTKILNTVLKMNNDQLNFNLKTLNDFRTAGGTTFEYLATFMKSSKEEVRLFGMEAASARRIMYGFMPRGAFRLINQLATSFDAIGTAMRGIRDGGEGADSMLATFLKVAKKIPSFDSTISKPLGRMFGKSGMVETRGSEGDIFQGLFDMTPEQSRQRSQGGVLAGLKSLKESAMEKRKARMASIKAFFTSPKWREVGKTMSFLGKGVVQNLSKFLFMAMIYMVLITVAISFLKKPIEQALEFASNLASQVLPMITGGFKDIFDGVVGIYNSLISGDIIGIIEGFWTIVWGVLQVVFGLILAAGAALLGFIVGFGLKVLEKGKDFIVDFLNFKGTLKDNLKRIIIIGVAVLAFIYGFPVIIAAVAITALGVLVKMIYKAIKSALGFKATGGIVTKDMTVVGERGPELVSLPKGSRVHSNSESRRMTGGVVNNYNITINAKDTSKAEMRRIADEIGRMVSSKINRRTSNRSSV